MRLIALCLALMVGRSAAQVPARGPDWGHLGVVADAHGVPRGLLRAIRAAESRTSMAGTIVAHACTLRPARTRCAWGPMQIKLATARAYCGIATWAELTNFIRNEDCGATILRALRDTLGSWHAAVVAYYDPRDTPAAEDYSRTVFGFAGIACVEGPPREPPDPP